MKFACLVENVCAEVGKPIHFRKPVGHVAQEHRHIVDQIRVRVSACAGAEQHHTRHAAAVKLCHGGAKRLRIGSLGAMVAILSI